MPTDGTTTKRRKTTGIPYQSLQGAEDGGTGGDNDGGETKGHVPKPKLDVRKWSDRFNLSYKWTNSAIYSPFKNGIKIIASTIEIIAAAFSNSHIPQWLQNISTSIVCGVGDGVLAGISSLISVLNVINYCLRIVGLINKRNEDFLSLLTEAAAREEGSITEELGRANALQEQEKIKRLRRLWALRKLFTAEDITAILKINESSNKNKYSELRAFLEQKMMSQTKEGFEQIFGDLKADWDKLVDDWSDWKIQWKTRKLTLFSASLSCASYMVRLCTYAAKAIAAILAGAVVVSIVGLVFSGVCMALTLVSVSINMYLSLKRYADFVRGEGLEGKKFHEEVCKKYGVKNWSSLSTGQKFGICAKAFFTKGTFGEVMGSIGALATGVIFVAIAAVGLSNPIGVTIAAIVCSAVAIACGLTYFVSYMRINAKRDNLAAKKPELTKTGGGQEGTRATGPSQLQPGSPTPSTASSPPYNSSKPIPIPGAELGQVTHNADSSIPKQAYSCPEFGGHKRISNLQITQLLTSTSPPSGNSSSGKSAISATSSDEFSTNKGAITSVEPPKETRHSGIYWALHANQTVASVGDPASLVSALGKGEDVHPLVTVPST